MPETLKTGELRIARIETANIVADDLTLCSVTCAERLSTLSQIVATVQEAKETAPKTLKDWADNLDLQVLIAAELGDDTGDSKTWYLSGYLTEVLETGDHDGEGDKKRTTRQLIIRPWFWYLAQDLNSRIFQNMSVIDIITSVVGSAGFSAQLDIKTDGTTYEKRPYTVQFRESSFNFLSRLMEEEGLYYFFRYTKTGHTMVVVDEKSKHPATEYTGDLPFNSADTGSGQLRKPHFWRWTARVANTPTKATLRDYVFFSPDQTNEHSKALKECNATQSDWSQKREIELYDSPSGAMIYAHDSGKMGDVSTINKLPKLGDRLVKVRLEAAKAGMAVYFGAGNLFGLHSGETFRIKGTTNADGGYLAVGVTQTLELEGQRSGTSTQFHLSTEIEAIPGGTQWRPPLITPKPVAGGPQTAKVVGPPGEEIYTDEFGRVKVQFFWDRQGKSNDKSSTWIRVAQSWANKGFGMMTLPRIGEEVVVDFIDGDPDHPLITGRVYNAGNMPAFNLPDNKTMSWLRSKSSPGSALEGGDDDSDKKVGDAAESPAGKKFNQLRFEDKTDSEEIFIRAQKDFNQVVRHDQTLRIGNVLTHVIGLDYKETVGQDHTQEVKRDYKYTVGGNYTLKLTGDQKEEVQGKREVTIQGNETLTIEQGNAKTTLSAGNCEITSSMGEIKLEAMTSIELKVGTSSIKVSQEGVEISGTMNKISGQAMVQIQAPMTQVSGDGMLTAKGGIVMIN